MIDRPYTLFTRIPLYRAEDGVFYTDDLWEKDLSLHLEYLPRFHICCPVQPWEPGCGANTPMPGLHPDRVVALRRDRGWGSVAANLIPNFLSVIRATKSGAIVHSSGAGWAFPLSYYLLLLRPFIRFQWLMVIESTFWMIPAGERPGLRKRLSEKLHRFWVTRCLRAADARLFTQDWYRTELLGEAGNCLITPASWIDEGRILDTPPARAPGPLRLIFPTRMIPEKGIETVLSAIEHYGRTPDAPPLELDLIGDGSLAARARGFVRDHQGTAALRFLDTVPYGPPFFELIRGYDGVLIANLTEEQPRIVFDAFSQALPCIASATNGIRSLVRDGENGYLFPPGDVKALTALLERLASAPDALADLKRPALDVARKYTHREMHRARERFLQSVFEPS